jgi:signal transduction histidine kinase
MTTLARGLTATGRLAFLAGGGEMGSLIRSHDWSATPLGAPEQWASSLKTAVGIMMASGYPMYIAWGQSFTQLYNDAYRPILGATKHPGALGCSTRETFREIWDFIGPMFEGVMASGTASTFIDQLLALDRYGYVEECYFTFSYSAVREDSGATGGVFVTVLETTERVLRERRERTIREIAEVPPRGGVDAICTAAARALAHNPHDVPFTLLFRAPDADGKPRLLAEGGTEGGLDETIAAVPAWIADAAGRGDGPLHVRLPRAVSCQPWPEPVSDALLVPITAIGHDTPVAWLVGGISPRLAVDGAYGKFFQTAVAAIGTLVAEAEAFEAERRRAEALAELDRAKTAFFSNVSHEFRTPLTLMLGPLDELLRDGTALDDDVRGRLEVVNRNAARLLKLVNTLLDFARIEAGRVQAVYEPTDLAALTTDLAGVFRSAVERAGLDLAVDCAPLPEPVYVDREMWEKIVLNFLSNALKFTFEGRIRVAVRAAGARAEMVVEDTGIGVAAAELPRLFERFHRVEGARARTHEGTGIGLALVRELVSLHGGDIAIESEVGRGTRFTVSIPFGAAHLPSDRVRASRTMASTAVRADLFVNEALRWLPDEPAARPTPLAAPDTETPRFRIVLADDNADMRDYVQRLLGERWDVESVADGAQALEAVARQRPDVVVTDVMMPNVDGFELVRRLRADPATSTIPIIMLSARAGEESRVEGLASGADDYLGKPFSARELIARVERQLLGALATARRDAEAASRAKDEFLALLGHELRNPLAPIATALHVMRLRDRGALESERAVIERQLRHMTRLVDDLLDVSRIARGKIVLQRERLELADVVRDAVETASPLLEQLGHHLAIDVPARGLLVEGDRLRLAQVVANLLNNAAKYTPSSGRIELTGRRDGDGVTLAVRDNGVGIAPDMLPHVFDLFVQARQGADRAHGGLGLGLAIAQSVTRLHGGHIVGASDGPGSGSTFTMHLPAVQNGEDRRETISRLSHADATTQTSGYRILVVDDNEDAALMLHYALTLAGHEIRVAHDGPRALSVARDFAPTVALLDLGLPVMDGFELARRLREQAGTTRITLIALTGYGQASDRDRTREAGFDAHLVKPIDPENLDSFIRGLAA